MFRVSMADLVTRLRFLLRPSGPPPADADLLSRFVEHHDQEAFAELVRQHGPMVCGVCRRALGDGPDAEDAYQAVFMVLAKRAEVVTRMRSVSGWLYGVAGLTARKARSRRARQQAREGAALVDTPAPPRAAEPDLGSVIDEELTAVPERYRTAVVLCELRQLTLDEAAAELGVPRGTVASRLARGRELLGKRLLRRGLFAVGGGVSSATAHPPIELDLKAVELGTNPDTAHELTREVLHAMNGPNRLWFLGLLGIAAVSLGLLFLPPTSAAPTPKADGPVPVDRVKLNGIGGLLDQPAVRKALDLSEEQEGKLKGVEKEVMAVLKVVGQPKPGPFGREQVNEKLNEALAQYDDKAAAVLTDTQKRRLKQFQLQKEGPKALLDRIAVRELALTSEQEDKLAEVLAPQLRARPFVNLPTKIAARNPQEVADIDKVLGSRAEAMDKVWVEALKVLTDAQRKKWKEMTGDPIPPIELMSAATEEFFFRLYMESLK